MLSIQKIIQSLKGTIFGGYVRDKILHDSNAIKYYKVYKFNYEKYNDAS